MQDFAAIDFETANYQRSSVCSVGVIIVRGGRIADRFYSLIKPEPEYHEYGCTMVHGLTEADTHTAPLFPEVWAEIEPKINGLPLVAHNKAFDENCLKAVFRTYQMDYPDYEFHCTCIAARKRSGLTDIIVWISLLPDADTCWKNTTMRLPMLKPVLPLLSGSSMQTTILVIGNPVNSFIGRCSNCPKL